jgi:A/G-specific adenine glycosylase
MGLGLWPEVPWLRSGPRDTFDFVLTGSYNAAAIPTSIMTLGTKQSTRQKKIPRSPWWPDRWLKRRFQQRLLRWYAIHGRDLPWRKTSDPYHILVSEVMLQQTQVDRVVPKYHQFLNRYPSFEELALAPVTDVKQLWYPLGYNIRPERLHSIACETIERYGGKLPNDHEQLVSFKGIGRYTAGAIRSFAFNEDAAILDTNVSRVLHRVFIARGNPKKQKMKLWKLAEALIPRGRGYDFNQAIMDFGALCCTARTPSCKGCTMKPICKTFPFLSRGTT